MSVSSPRGVLVLSAAISALVAGCQPTTSPSLPDPPTIDSVMRLPASGLPIMIPQSLGGEYRALPETNDVARRLAFDQRDVVDASRIELLVDGTAVARGDTSGTLNPG